MRWFQAPLLCLALLTGSWSSPIGVMPGQWEGKPEDQEAPPSYMLDVGPPANRRFTFVRIATEQSAARLVATGTYAVTGDRGQNHLSFSVERIYSPESGQDLEQADFSGWQLHTGQVARVYLDFQGNDLLMETYQPAESPLPVARFRLRALGAEVP